MTEPNDPEARCAAWKELALQMRGAHAAVWNLLAEAHMALSNVLRSGADLRRQTRDELAAVEQRIVAYHRTATIETPEILRDELGHNKS